MTGEPTARELELARRILAAGADRPHIVGAGLFGALVNFLSKRLTRGLIQTALVGFFAYHGWQYFNSAQQMSADLDRKRSQAQTEAANAEALKAKIGDMETRTALLRAQLDKLQAEGESARADADAQAAIVKDGTIRLATLKAELETTIANAIQAKAFADAQNDPVEGVILAIAQRKADIAKVESENQRLLNNIAFLMRLDMMDAKQDSGGVTGDKFTDDLFGFTGQALRRQ